MDLRELFDLVLRWLHVIAAIMWIGNSLLFNWLDRNLEQRADARPGSRGSIWLLHSGGFYDVEKTLEPRGGLPRPLHWFKWQAYTTWLSGAALLVVVYYMSGAALLLAPEAGLSPREGAAVSVGTLAGGLLVYELLWRSPLGRRAALAGALSFALLLGVAWWLGTVFTGRAAFLHVGALLGTLMAANVFLTIMPSQRQLVAEVGRGEPGDPRVSDRAKTRSIHNNYLTFPVIALMLSSHFPGLYSGDVGWLVIGAIFLLGAGARHVLNVRFAYRRVQWVPAFAGVVAAGLALVWLAASPPAGSPSRDDLAAGPVSFEQVEAVIHKRCTVCHSASPADRTFGPTSAAVAFDSPEQIRALAPRIRARAVETETMPPGNKTFMTTEEREVLRRWVAQAER